MIIAAQSYKIIIDISISRIDFYSQQLSTKCARNNDFLWVENIWKNKCIPRIKAELKDFRQLYFLRLFFKFLESAKGVAGRVTAAVNGF